MTNFAFAVGGIEEGRNCSSESGGVVGDGELPGIGEENRDDFARLESGAYKSAGQGFDQLAVLGVGEAAVARRIDERGFSGKATAGF